MFPYSDKLELRRQIFHILLGLVIVLALFFEIINAWILFLIVLAGGLLCYLAKKTSLPLLNFFLRNFERPEQRKLFPGRGTLFFFIGTLLAVKLFPQDIALASIMVLTLGDSVSHLFGHYFGKTKNPLNNHSPKLLEGTIAGTLTGLIGALLFIPPLQAFLAVFAAMLAETVEMDLNRKHVDDNLLVPLVAGAVVLLFRNFFG